MKILLLCNKIPYPPYDGGSIAVLNLMLSLGRLGHNITLLSMITRKHDLSANDRILLEQQVSLHTVDMDTTITWTGLVRNLLFTREPYILKRFISKSFENELIHVLLSCSFDIIQLEGIYLCSYLNVIKEHSKAPVALRSHNIEHKIWGGIAEYTRNPIKRLYLRNMVKRIAFFEMRCINRYDLLIPITENDRVFFDRMGNRKPVMVCNSGYDVEKLPSKYTEPNSYSLFFLGALDWIPNQQGLAWFVSKVIPILCRKHPDLVVYIAGRNASPGFISKLTHPNIIFCGEVTDAREFIESKGISVVPLFSGSGMRIKIIEAMALGKPVVATSKAAEGIEATPEENILIADNRDEFIAQIEKLLDSTELSGQIGRSAMELVRRQYDNMEIASALTEFYINHLP